MNHVRESSKSGGRKNINRNNKGDLATESYVANEQSVGVRRVMAGLQADCLTLGVDTGRYTETLYCQWTCRLCVLGRWRTTPFSNCLSHI